MTIRTFDLNIEEVLENWEVEHALREVIANALDEQTLTQTKEIEIKKDANGNWQIRDFGRGLKIEHFTLNECPEKLNSQQQIIGKFGVGLKDALATFHRRGINVLIRSQNGSFRLKQVHKYGFENIVTLHVEYDDAHNDLIGTEFIFNGVHDSDIEKAKSLFLKFTGEEILDTNEYGQILEREDDSNAHVYILGVLASDEPNFLFSYNITSLTEAMRKRLNRERLNVGRTTYSDRVKSIIKNANSEFVKQALVDQVRERATGEQCDEMSWIEISQIALNLMDDREQIVYFTEQELQDLPEVIDQVKDTGREIVVISEQQKTKLVEQIETGGPVVTTTQVFIQDFNAGFQYNFIEYENLTTSEKLIFDYNPRIISLVGIPTVYIPKVRISETIQITQDNSDGVWDRASQTIIIKRSKLTTLSGYAGTLLHELAHATTNLPDVSRAFEMKLTEYLGRISSVALK